MALIVHYYDKYLRLKVEFICVYSCIYYYTQIYINTVPHIRYFNRMYIDQVFYNYLKKSNERKEFHCDIRVKIILLSYF